MFGVSSEIISIIDNLILRIVTRNWQTNNLKIIGCVMWDDGKDDGHSEKNIL